MESTNECIVHIRNNSGKSMDLQLTNFSLFSSSWRDTAKVLILQNTIELSITDA